jgi:hypothetical protein
MSIRIHFWWHSNYCLTAVANSLAAIVMVTPTKVSVRLSLSRERPIRSPSRSRTRRNPQEQSLVTSWVPEMLNAVVGEPLHEKRGKRLLVHGPSVKTTHSVGVAKTYWVPRVLAALSSFWERNHLFIFSSYGAILHSWFFHPVSSESAVSKYFKSLICYWSHLVSTVHFYLRRMGR